MTRIEAVTLLREYQEVVERRPALSDGEKLLVGIADRFPSGGSERKAMRWLGFAQGVLVAAGVFSLEQVREHSRRKWVQ